MAFATFNGENPTEPIVEYCFINAGRSYALVKSINISCLTVDNIPANPPYDDSKTRIGHILFTPNAFLGTETTEVTLEKCKISMPLSVSDWQEIRAGKKFLIVIGFVKYDSAFEVTYTHGFGYCFHIVAKRLAIIENDQYSYDRKQPQA